MEAERALLGDGLIVPAQSVGLQEEPAANADRRATRTADLCLAAAEPGLGCLLRVHGGAQPLRGLQLLDRRLGQLQPHEALQSRRT